MLGAVNSFHVLSQNNRWGQYNTRAQLSLTNHVTLHIIWTSEQLITDDCKARYTLAAKLNQHGRLCWKKVDKVDRVALGRTHWWQSRPYWQQSWLYQQQSQPRQAVELKLLTICCQNRQQSRPYRWQSTLLLICCQFRQQSTLSPVCTGL